VTQETKEYLTNVYQILEHQEGKLVDLHRSIRAILEAMKTQDGFLEAYGKHYEGPGSSETALGYTSMLAAIREKVQRLRERAA
jgi:hypothetical protein